METQSSSIKEIAKALLNAQSVMGNAPKTSANPFFKSKYADLNSVREACMTILNDAKISVIQPTVFLEGKPFVKTMLVHESGEWICGYTEIVCAKPNDAQAHGSGVTYARRYGLQSLVNIGSEDDDGNAASTPGTPAEKPQIEWLSEDQFLAAMKSDKKGILATLKAYNGQSGKSMKKEYNQKLTEQLSKAPEKATA